MCDHNWIYAITTFRKCDKCWREEMRHLGKWVEVEEEDDDDT